MLKRQSVVLIAVLMLFFFCSEHGKEKNTELNKSSGLSEANADENKNLIEKQISGKHNLKKETEKKKESESAIKVTFIELGSVNCIPCRMMQPIMKEIEEKYQNQVKVVFYDVWTPEGNPYAGKYRIRVIPTQVFLDKDGKEYYRHEGYFPKDELVKILKMGGVNE